MRICVTGGLGFIGSAVVRRLVSETGHEVLNLDKQTYAGDPRTVAEASRDRRYRHARVDICDGAAVRRELEDFRPDAVVNLAAESHVDRSIDGPVDFIQTNLVGTFTLLEAALDLHRARAGTSPLRFVQVSTDEVFGALGADDPPFDENSSYAPRSPYSATKAGADHLARAWGATFGLPVIVTNCSNNHGPWQYPEKLIPLTIGRALDERPCPVYGSGENVRDWLRVDDHAAALVAVVENGTPGATYMIGGGAERRNIDVVEAVCDLVDERAGTPDAGPRRRLVRHVSDRPGHDHRYAVDAGRIRDELGWRPSVSFEEGLAATVDWYLANQDWWRPLIAAGADARRGAAR